MAERFAVFSPQRYARLGGALYLAIIVFGAFAEGFVTNRLVVANDPAATAHNITMSAPLWHLGLASDFLVVLLAVPLLWIEYLLLRPAGRHLILLAVMFNLVSLAVEAISKLFLFLVAPTLLNPGFIQAFAPAQLQVLAGLAIRSHDVAFNIALIFFSFTCLLYGYVIFRSGFLPRTIGVLMQLAGGGYLAACLTALFAPGLSDSITPFILVFPFVGETSFCLWLLLKGVNVERWRERAGVEPLVA